MGVLALIVLAVTTLVVVLAATGNEAFPGLIGIGVFLLGLGWLVLAAIRKEQLIKPMIVGTFGLVLLILALVIPDLL